MKKKSLFIALALCVSFFCAMSQTTPSRTVVSSPGKLYDILWGDKEPYPISELTITGEMDSTDFGAIKTVQGLSYLDISKVKVVRIIPSLIKPGIDTVNINRIPNYSLENSIFKTIVLPESIVSIGDYAFKNSENIITIKVQGMVSSIGIGAFSGCTNLFDIDVSNTSITRIEDELFHHCTNLPAIKLPVATEYIGINAFSKCFKLNNIIIPPSTSYIGYFAFDSCITLTSVVFPKQMSSIKIDNYAFTNCSSLKKIALPTGLKEISTGLFNGCSSLPMLEIPEGVQSIMGSVVIGCTSLIGVVIPSTASDIRYDAFEDCNGMFQVSNTNMNYSSEKGILYNKNKTKLIRCPSILPDSLAIPSSVTTIGWAAFSNCSKITSVQMPTWLKYIDTKAFKNCTGLTSIDLPATTEIIGDESFAGCVNITSINSFLVKPEVVSLYPTSFSDVNKKKCVVTVPPATLRSYRAIKEWNAFSNIVEQQSRPTTRLGAQFHNKKLETMKTIIICIKTPGVTLYQYQFTDEKTGAVYTHYNKGNSLYVSDVSGLSYNKQYIVKVRVFYGTEGYDYSIGARIYTPKGITKQ